MRHGGHGPSPLSRPESVSSSTSSHQQDWDTNNMATIIRKQNQLSKLSPGVTDSSSSLSTLGLGFRKYLQQGSLYDTNDGNQHVPVRSVFTESGYYSNKAKLIESSNINDKLSIRAEVSKPTPAVRKKEGIAARLEPGVTTRVPPTGGSFSPKTKPSSSSNNQDILSGTKSEGVMIRNDNIGEHSIKEHIISTQMRKINRELPISEVYHERSLGLGLAPPLSTLIMSNNIAVAQVDHHGDPGHKSDNVTPPLPADNMSNFDNLSVIEDAHPSRRKPKLRPPVPPKPVQEPWIVSSTPPGGLNKNDIIRNHPPANRDDGDGRSMTDSQYSGCSPSASGSTKDLPTKFNYAMKIKDSTKLEGKLINKNQNNYSNVVNQNIYSVPDEDVSVEDAQVTRVISPNIHPNDIAHYINTEFHSKKTPRPLNAQHPQMWSKDKNGRFTYNGNLASDC